MSYTQSLAGIISSMIYFDSSTAASFRPNEDSRSPYFEDKYGNIHLKEEVDQFVNTYNQTFYRDLFFAVATSDPTPDNLTVPLVMQDEEGVGPD